MLDWSTYKRFAGRLQGNLAVITAFVMSALAFGAGIAVDYGSMVSKRGTLQAVSDAAAIAVAREMVLGNTGTTELEAVANNMVSAKLGSTGSTWTVSVTIDENTASAQISVLEYWSPMFAHLLSKAVTPISTSATAALVGSGKVCVIGLEASQARAVHLKRSAQLTAVGCGVFSNSVSTDGMRIDNSGVMTASMICSSGGAGGAALAYKPSVTTDCPPVPDPLMDRVAPTVGMCDFNLFEAETPMTISPGVYCGGLVVASTDVTFEPGIYIIKDGPLEAAGAASLTGVNVGFYLTGTDAGILFGSKSTISLTAPKDGDLAGLLFFEDRGNLEGFAHRITSNNARVLLGTIYLSKGTLFVDANAPVADQSAYTAIIARKLTLDAGPNLVLNADYGLTDIPVPGNLSGSGGRIVLSQ